MHKLEETVSQLRELGQKKKNRRFTPDFKEERDVLDELHREILHLVAERHKELEQLKKLENYRKEFLGNVSHELKTPIFNIQGYISTLIDGGLQDENINMAYLKRADRSVDRMIHIIDDLETISQLESGGFIIETEKFDLSQLILEVMEQLELQAAKKNIRLIPAEKYGKIKVMADKFRIRQVLANLLMNSIKYGKEGGQTTITLQQKGEIVSIKVSDDGIGIAEEHLPRLFERFYRVDKGRSREQGGTGLGLAIVKHILEAHEQSIQVTSEVGKGTTFQFTLRLA